nr:hypothetical protein CFP56_76700 [Quercus suber]
MQPHTLSRYQPCGVQRRVLSKLTFIRKPNPEFTVKTSFKDKLVGEIPRAYAQAFDLTDHMDEDVDSDDENGEASNSVREGLVKIKLSKETM